MGVGEEKGRCVGQGVKGRQLQFGCVMAIRLIVINALLFIPPCKVAATNMSDLNKRQVSQRVTERKENLAQRKTQLLHKETDIKETPKKNL